VYQFASPTMQSWWVGSGPSDICVSYAELMCGYFDELDLGGGLEPAVGEGWMGGSEVRAVAEFHDKASAYREPSSDHEAILGDPAWADVVRAAQLAWRSLRAVVDPEDRAVMNELEAKWGRIAPAN
jgi:hypothetical protein